MINFPIEELKNFLQNCPDLPEGFGFSKMKIEFLTQSLFPVYKISSKQDFALKIISNQEMAKSEFRSLQILDEYNIPVPKPYRLLEFQNHFLLLMDYISFGNADREKAFGETLELLYSVKSEKWGLSFSNFIGTLPQPNSEFASFYEFFWKCRWESQVDLAIQNRNLEVRHKLELEKILQKSESWGIGKIFPRLIHGDLWSGNAIWGSSKMVLIDPSISYSHPEQDLGMAVLFGGFPSYRMKEILVAVELDPEGFRDRVSFWQIYPLLVHVNIFGNFYRKELENAMSKYLY